MVRDQEERKEVTDYKQKASTEEFTYDDKVAALKDLVYEAAMESSNGSLSRVKSAYAGPAFDARDFQTYHQDALLDAIKRTDALYVLNDLLNEGRA